MDGLASSPRTFEAESSPHRATNPLAAELLEGLTQPQKCINPKFLYDDVGSQLFEEITRTPEYYPTRTEIGILETRADAIAGYAGKGSVLIEPGAGSCAKAKYLLDALRPAAYVPQDICFDFLQQAAVELRDQFPGLDVRPLVGDFSETIELPSDLPQARRVAFYPGSTIGNFDLPQAAEFLRTLRHLVGREGGVIIGVDLQKDPSILNAAYNDSAGVTAAFNVNALKHVNRILDADFDVNQFEHRAFYNSEKHRVEMHLVSKIAQRVDCGEVVITFAKGETIHTESSYKYTLESFNDLAQKAGFEVKKTWTDDRNYFSVHYME
jgi:dimethylhistidine N-methyltransferase